MPAPRIDTADTYTVREQFRSWIEGASARARGEPLHANPHRERSIQADAWENAWEIIDRELRDAETLSEKR